MGTELISTAYFDLVQVFVFLFSGRKLQDIYLVIYVYLSFILEFKSRLNLKYAANEANRFRHSVMHHFHSLRMSLNFLAYDESSFTL